MKKPESEWKTVLSPEQFKVLREKGTEPPGTGEYNDRFDSGIIGLTLGTYNCAGCDNPLYKSTSKFKSGCGWPAFYESIPGSIKQQDDNSFGAQRIELMCAKCDGHLGHLFKGEGYDTPTNERHCINSISLKFK